MAMLIEEAEVVETWAWLEEACTTKVLGMVQGTREVMSTEVVLDSVINSKIKVKVVAAAKRGVSQSKDRLVHQTMLGGLKAAIRP